MLKVGDIVRFKGFPHSGSFALYMLKSTKYRYHSQDSVFVVSYIEPLAYMGNVTLVASDSTEFVFYCDCSGFNISSRMRLEVIT